MVWQWAKRVAGSLRVRPEKLLADPLLAAHSLSPQRVCEVAGVQRLAELGPKNARVVPLAELLDTAQTLHILREALHTGVVILFVGTDTAHETASLKRAFNQIAVRVDEGENWHRTNHQSEAKEVTISEGDEHAVFAINVTELLTLSLKQDQAGLEAVLHGMPTHHTQPQALALMPDSMPVQRVSWLRRALSQPSFPVYLIVFVYSSLRVLPVAFISQFHGNLLVLWLIDIITAVPYTWGVLAMLFAPTRKIRVLATAITIVTFVGPYVYFWFNGKGYPPYVPIVIAALTAVSVWLEFSKYRQEQRLRRDYLTVPVSPLVAAS